jgi:hypothetical protein
MKAIETLLSATLEDVALALNACSFGNWPQDEADLLEFFMLMIDTKLAGTALGSSESCIEDSQVNFRSSTH